MNEAKNIYIALLLLTGVGMGIFWVATKIAPSTPCMEQVTGDTPQAKVAAYVKAIVAGDESAALDLWKLPQGQLPQERYDALSQRRMQVTRGLLSTKIHPDFLVLDVEWWRTCCEPSVICDSRNAGGARLNVQFLDDHGLPLLYVFDVFVKETVYWGDAAGNPPRHWVIRDVYPFGQEPLFWRMVYEPKVRFLDK